MSVPQIVVKVHQRLRNLHLRRAQLLHGDSPTVAEAGVAVVPASAFGWNDGFRISFAADDRGLEEAMARIAVALR